LCTYVLELHLPRQRSLRSKVRKVRRVNPLHRVPQGQAAQPAQRLRPAPPRFRRRQARSGPSETSGAPGTSGATAGGSPPVAGRSELGVTVVEMEALVLGWSAKKDLLGKTVQNDKKERIGKIDDIIITPKNSVSFAIIGAGGFLGIARHDVAIPMEQLKTQDGNFVLPGATKEALKALPRFEYARK
jgi:hypothetical protein